MGLLAVHVLGGVDDAVRDQTYAQQTLIAGIAGFIVEQQSEVEGRQLVKLKVLLVFARLGHGLEEGFDSGCMYVYTGIREHTLRATPRPERR